MADIVHFPLEEAVAADEPSETAQDTFLIDEGLDLLAAYRAIVDPAVRASVRHLVKTLALSGCRAAGGR